ncbi:FxsA family protein [Vibrio breoganii]|uniref:Membrane protein FxsA n=1 Tax=Vibrio breoganii TaxID=553239 RepID=A0AAJ3VLQ2_9VIBR|nr:FxsA family protein [Vibrio breoganii]ANO33909.1 membrane protein FxsA [Vibrio breoganii]MDN3716126.1 FxsA family protein [Vibrio breoganii]NMO72830.1 membrane protein FxsA [Vibrio breoganii]NMR69992.1 membrane protein FxsA [Vibrio breoganii]OED99488.1 membrane protein FxsA [Vibrio breoganii ZF-29]
MFPILLLLFILVPIVEIGLFIQVGGFLGVWTTIFLVILTALIGASLVRSQGIATLLSVQSRLQQGEMPAQQIIEGVMLAVAGMLLLTPGFMTDALGMLVLLPKPRAIIAQQLMKRVQVNSMHSGFQSHTHFEQRGPFDSHQKDDGNVFEGEFEKKDDQDKDRLN